MMQRFVMQTAAAVRLASYSTRPIPKPVFSALKKGEAKRRKLPNSRPPFTARKPSILNSTNSTVVLENTSPVASTSAAIDVSSTGNLNGSDSKPNRISKYAPIFGANSPEREQAIKANREKPLRTYFVNRSSTLSLPVYCDVRGKGGSNRSTMVRLVSGSVDDLVSDIIKDIPSLGDPNLTILKKPESNKVIFKTDCRLDLVHWLAAQGF